MNKILNNKFYNIYQIALDEIIMVAYRKKVLEAMDRTLKLTTWQEKLRTAY